jgi:phosphoribosylanthranilate isomerase
MLVKICGLTNIIDTTTAVEAGASALGFVMGGKVLPVEIEPPAQVVREIIRGIPAAVDTFVVTHLKEPEDILALAEYVCSSGIQISEDIGVDKVRAVRERTGRKIIKTVVVRDETSIDKLKSYEPLCDFILLDSQLAGYVGGTGATSDWNLCKRMVQTSSKPVYLAGGLNPENLSEAIRFTEPHGVDVSTGVSTHSESFLRKDRKDPEKIRAFVALARNAVKHAIS